MFADFTVRWQRHELLPGRTMPLRIDYRRRHNARRYILRVNERGDGGCVTIPRGGSWAEARRFALRNAAWLEKRLQQEKEKASQPQDCILFRGELLPLTEVFQRCFNCESARLIADENLRARVCLFLRNLAARELPTRVAELAPAHGLMVRRVMVRNQRSRWGSCSAKGVISLNWRLVQTPEFVRDYIIVHELMHLREMNHSARFWNLVEAAFPRTDEAERWLKANGGLLRS
ncbi:MAG TPA: SprT family zinc-dependent metalloprotease [Verrucomicrobiae bacterium]|nr:SprT family zinc-dependent metalloprotease [Verrucomicrobiae bacterium]